MVSSRKSLELDRLKSTHLPLFVWFPILQLNNDAVNVINISLGSILAVLMQQVILQK